MIIIKTIKQKPRFGKLICILALALGLTIFAAVCPKITPSASAYWWDDDDLDTPVISSASSTDKGVKLTWDRVYGADKYRVFVKNGSSWKGLGNTTGTVFYHTAAVSGKTYTYTVRCISEDGRYFTSDYQRSGKTITFIAMPVINKLSNLENSVSIGWNAVPGAAKYRVFQKIGSSWKKIGDTTASTFIHKNVVSGKRYIYTVRCLSRDSKSYTSAYYAAGKAVTFVKAPAVTSVTDEPTGVRIKWDACAGAERYRVYIRSDNHWKTIAETSDTSYLHYADNNTEYTYTLRCFNANGKAVSYYHEAGWKHYYSFQGTLDAPVIKDIVNTKDGPKLSWDPVPGAEKYRVLLRGYYTWTLLADTEETEFLHADAVAGTYYTYTVCCIDSESSRNTSVYDNIGKTNLYVGTPVIRSIENTSIGPKITWDACPGAVQYRLIAAYRGKWLTLGDTTKTEFIHTDAIEDNKYTYKVYCIDEEGAPMQEIPLLGKSNKYLPNADYPIYTNAMFAADMGAILGSDMSGISDPNAPLTRENASEIIVGAMGYGVRTAIPLSDSESDALKTAAYYGYLTPDAAYRIFPSRYITGAEYARFTAEADRFVRLSGKRILAFGDSIMFGKGNNGAGIVCMLCEKYNMSYSSYAYNGASFGTQNTRRHISDEILEAHNANCQADIILINGGTNDMSLVSKGSETDFFNPNDPDKSTLAAGMRLSMDLLREHFNGVPVLYIRSHNMNSCSDTLERQMGECAVRIAESSGVYVADIFSDTTLNTRSSTQCSRYTSNPAGSGVGDSVHPNALCYAGFYLPLITERVEQMLAQEPQIAE